MRCIKLNYCVMSCDCLSMLGFLVYSPCFVSSSIIVACPPYTSLILRFFFILLQLLLLLCFLSSRFSSFFIAFDLIQRPNTNKRGNDFIFRTYYYLNPHHIVQYFGYPCFLVIFSSITFAPISFVHSQDSHTQILVECVAAAKCKSKRMRETRNIKAYKK